MRHIPLLVVPFLLYNAFAFLVFADAAVDFREAQMGSVRMASGATFTLSVSASIILLALLLLAIEVVKAARIGRGAITDHVLATLLFVAFLVEFLLVAQAATGTFVILMAIALVDLVCGFAVSIRTATRDISFDQ
jgi:hypothetical protein